MHAFESQGSRQTLAEGVAEYYRLNPTLAAGRDMSQAAQEFFRCHDAAHVLYGCGNSLSDEAIVKLSSIFGTTGRFSVLEGYRLHESLQIYKQLGVFEILLTILHSVFLVPRTIARCFRQRGRWPWSDFEKYLQVPLWEIRREFGIRVARGPIVRNC
jgi:hypothetical protein